MPIKSVLKATGAYLPEKVLTNADLEKMVDTSDEWIQQRSGIKTRHVAAEEQTTADLAIEAAKQALERSGLSPDYIDGVIAVSYTHLTLPTILRV